MKKFKIKSYCKINLSLRVLKKLKNGYHSIASLITFCDLYDIISISKINGSKDKINFSGPFKSGIDVKLNTITKMFDLIRKERLIKNQFFKINVQKNIPHGSGLGGGSSNAASLINYLNLKISKKKKLQLASQIGSDVPVCLKRKNTFLKNSEKKMFRFKKRFNLDLLIVYPNLICSTKKIYKNYKNKGLSRSLLCFTDKKKLFNFLKKENNDLEDVVVKIYPRVGELIKYIKSQKGCNFSRITGSGSACIGVFSNKRNAIYAKQLVNLKYPNYWCVVSKTI